MLTVGHVRVHMRRLTGARSFAATSASVLILAGIGGSFAGPDTVSAASTTVVEAPPAVVVPLGIDGGFAPDAVLPTISSAAASTATPAPSVSTAPTPSGRAVAVAGDLMIPARVLAAYRNATATLARTEPGCHLGWQLLAGIGRIESDHAWLGDVRPDGTTVDLIVGPALDGSPGVAQVHDTDRGRWDGDRVWDRAVGPMQFIPTTWAVLGRDGNGDGLTDPSNVDDATVSAGFYLCGHGRDLDDPAQLVAAVHSYNHSDAYVAAVLAWAQAYTDGPVAAAHTPVSRQPSASAPTPKPKPSGAPAVGVPGLPGPVLGEPGGASATPTPYPTPSSCPTASADPSASSDPTAPSSDPLPPTSQPSPLLTPTLSPGESEPPSPGDGSCPTPGTTTTPSATPTATDSPSATDSPVPGPTALPSD